MTILDPQARAGFSAERGLRDEHLISQKQTTLAVDGTQTIIFSPANNRVLESVMVWFASPAENDRVKSIEIWDGSGGGANKIYDLSDGAAARTGWRIPLPHPIFNLPQLFAKKGRRKILAGWELRIKVKKATNVAEDVYVNVGWSKL